ncbi:MAG: hypothetical protein ACSLE7_10980 [Mycobacterium sp.]|jgi:hypothetical protein
MSNAEETGSEVDEARGRVETTAILDRLLHRSVVLNFDVSPTVCETQPMIDAAVGGVTIHVLMTPLAHSWHNGGFEIARELWP